MESISRLLLENKAWAAEKLEDDPKYFERLALTQTPQFLWIGCSDSRVPANEVTGTQPGEIFVHRNIANLVVENDVNMLSVLEYAVAHLKVKHVIVCGHYGCGGINAALSGNSFGVIDPWLQNIKNVIGDNYEELYKLPEGELRSNRLVDLTVKQQVKNLSATDTIQKAWKEGDAPRLHGWVYGLKDGILNSVFEMKPGSISKEAYIGT